MSAPESTLPLKIEPYLDESGLGFCLRAVNRNGSNLYALRRLMGVSATAQLRRSHAPVLAGLFDVSESWLQNALPDGHSVSAKMRRYLGSTFFAHNHLRSKCPQVCARCVQRHGYCRSLWDLSMTTVCLQHRCQMVDRCQKCLQALRWDRPSVDVGHCGHYIAPMKEEPAIDPELFRFQELLERIANRDRVLQSGGRRDWDALLSKMSLGGLCMLVAAFGSMERPLNPLHTSQSSRGKGCADWHVIVLRGLRRLRSFELGESKELNLSDVVARPFLMRLLNRHAEHRDQQVALNILERLFGVLPDRKMHEAFPYLGQLTLF